MPIGIVCFPLAHGIQVFAQPSVCTQIRRASSHIVLLYGTEKQYLFVYGGIRPYAVKYRVAKEIEVNRDE